MISELKSDKPNYPEQVITFDVMLPPSVNHMYIHLRNGSKILTAKAKEYVQAVKQLCKTEIIAQGWEKDNDFVWYYMDLDFYFPDKRKRDTHNCLKLLLDTLEGDLYYNDYFVLPRVQSVTLDKNNPRVKVTLKPIIKEIE